MFAFGKHSMKFIDQLHPDLQDVLLTAINDAPRDFCIICGHRSKEEQNKAYNAGNSQLKYPQSKHNKMPALAFDFAPYEKANPHIRWEDIDAFTQVAEHILETALELGVELEWGGDWESFKDYPHIQLGGA